MIPSHNFNFAFSKILHYFLGNQNFLVFFSYFLREEVKENLNCRLKKKTNHHHFFRPITHSKKYILQGNFAHAHTINEMNIYLKIQALPFVTYS